MWNWFKRMFAAAAGKWLVHVLVGQAGLVALVLEFWDYIVSAPWTFQLALAVIFFSWLGVAGLLATALLYSPLTPGTFAPRHLRRFKWPFRRLSWDFDGYLGMGSGQGQSVLIYSFQPRLRVNWGDGIKPTAAYIVSRLTGQRRDLLIECGNPYLKAQDIEHIPCGVWLQCQALFIEHKTDSTDPQTREAVLTQFPGFQLVFEYEGGRFTRSFTRFELMLMVDRFWEYSNRLPDPRPTARASTA